MKLFTFGLLGRAVGATLRAADRDGASNPPFLIFDIRALGRSVLSQSAQMSKIKNGGLDQYGNV